MVNTHPTSWPWDANKCKKNSRAGITDLSDTESTENGSLQPYLMALERKQVFSNRKHPMTGLSGLSDTESTQNGSLQPYTSWL